MNSSSILPDRRPADDDESSHTLSHHEASSGTSCLHGLSLNGEEGESQSQSYRRIVPALSREQLKLRNLLLLENERRSVSSVLVTGVSEGVGATSVAATLALGLCQDPKREVLLIDANGKRPHLHRLFELRRTDGFMITAHTGTYLEMAAMVGMPNLKVLPSGGTEAHSPFDARRLISIMPALREAFDFVIVDAAPYGLEPEVMMLSMHLHGVILVAEAQRTRMQEMQEIIDEINRARASLLGVVLNREREELPASLRKWL